jgi:heat shock protein HslJ/outer membrane murein-binding lipoprotein Lpp
MKTVIVIVIAAALLGLAGCGSQTPQEAMTEFCTNLQAFDTAVQQLEQITPENTVGEAKQARDGVTDAWKQVTSSAENLAEVRVDSIEDAWTSLERTVDSISNKDTIADAAAEVSAGAAQVRSAIADVGSVSCPDLNLGGAAAQPAAGEAVATAPAAESAPAADTGVAGSYTGQMPPTNGSQETITMTLHPNGEASMVFSPASAAEGAEQAAAERILVGRWTENADQTVSAAFDRLQDGNELAIPEAFTFSRQDGQLVAVEYNVEVYGPSGFSMQKSLQVVAAPAGSDVVSATVSTGVTNTVTAPITSTTGVAPAETGAASPAALVGTVWQLQGIQQGAAVTTVPDPTLYTLTLSDGGSAQATGACSLGAGSYQVSGNSISFQLAWSATSCAQTSLDRQFANYLDYANAYALEPDALVIYFNNNSGQMTFAPGQ